LGPKSWIGQDSIGFCASLEYPSQRDSQQWVGVEMGIWVKGLSKSIVGLSAFFDRRVDRNSEYFFVAQLIDS
jgi:hypothetical protein